MLSHNLQTAWSQDLAFLGAVLAVNGARDLVFKAKIKNGIAALACGILLIGAYYKVQSEDLSGRVSESGETINNCFKFKPSL